MKTKLILSPFVLLGFNENSFFTQILGFKPYWDCKPTKILHVEMAGVYTNEKI